MCVVIRCSDGRVICVFSVQKLVLGQSVQAQRDKERLHMEINESVVQATQLLRKRYKLSEKHYQTLPS